MSANQIMSIIRTIQRDLIVSGWHPRERVEISVKSDYHTACWSFIQPNKHRIYVGNDVTMRMKPGLSQAQQEHHIGSYICHEYSHALHTERDFSAVHAMLAEISCPFELFNLFEDARIERLWRNLTARPFNWDEHEMTDAGVALSAAGIFFLFVQGEGAFPVEIPVPDPGLLKEVEEFYRKSCEAPDALALKDVLAFWVERFGVSVPPNIRFISAGEGEFATALLLQNDTAFRGEFDAGAMGQDEGKNGARAPENHDTDVAINGHIDEGLLSSVETGVNESDTAKLARRFQQLFRDKSRNYYSEEGSKRVSATRFALNRPYYRHRAIEKTRTHKIGLVVDCSGSMNGPHIEAGRELIATLNLLARQGRVTGALVLSGIADDIALSASFNWPVKDEVIRRIHAFGNAEGLQSAITIHAATLSVCDQVYVFTDGDILDEPLRLSPLLSRGISVCGLYVGSDPSKSDCMQRHFDRFYMRETLAELIDALLSDRSRKRT